MLRLRLIFGGFLSVVLVGLLAVDGWLWNLEQDASAALWLKRGAICSTILAVFVGLSAGEALGFVQARGGRPPRRLVQAGAVLLALTPYLSYQATGRVQETWGLLALSAVLIGAFILQAARLRTENALANVSASVFITLYIGGLAHFLLRLRMEVPGPGGAGLLLFTVFIVKMTDVGAYFVGRLIGRHKLIPWLSPNKTWEGFVGGLVVAALAALGLGKALLAAGWFDLPTCGGPAWVCLLGFGLVMGLLSVAGDLCASLLKRDAQVKDSGAALPGLGGVLDVLDSPLLAAPVAWFFWTQLR